MFAGVKRGAFVAKHGYLYQQIYGGEITKVQVQLAQGGWPVNDFIDWFIAANSEALPFCAFMDAMRRWVILDDTHALGELGKWSQAPAVRAAGPKGLVGWLEAMVRGARERPNAS